MFPLVGGARASGLFFFFFYFFFLQLVSNLRVLASPGHLLPGYFLSAQVRLLKLALNCVSA